MYRVLAPVCLALVATACLDAPQAVASVVYSQAGDGQACANSCWTSDYGVDNQGANFAAFDNFTIAGGASVTTVSWQGFYYDYENSGNNPVSPVTNQWKIGFYANDGGLPGTSLYSATIAASNVLTTFLGTDTFNDTVNVYNFTATLPTTFTANAGVTYWFSPVSVQPDGNPIFSWSSAVATVDGLSAQASPVGGAPYSRPGDRAFTLSSVPEPSAWALMLIGFAAIGISGRRRSSARAAPLVSRP